MKNTNINKLMVFIGIYNAWNCHRKHNKFCFCAFCSFAFLFVFCFCSHFFAFYLFRQYSVYTFICLSLNFLLELLFFVEFLFLNSCCSLVQIIHNKMSKCFEITKNSIRISRKEIKIYYLLSFHANRRSNGHK